MILVTGATGKVGTELIKELRTRGAAFRALAHSDTSAEQLNAQGINIVRGDFAQPEQLQSALQGIERLFLLTPSSPAQTEWEGALATAAQAAGVQHIVKLSVLAAERAPEVTLLRWHGESEERIKASGVPYTFLRPNSFMQNIVPLYAQSIAHQSALFVPAADAHISHIDTRDIAAVAATVLTESGYFNQAYDLTGSESLSYAHIADKFSTLLDKPVQYVPVSDEDARQAMLAGGIPPWYVENLLELFRFYREGQAANVSDAIQQLTGRAPRTLDAYLAENKQAFTSA